MQFLNFRLLNFHSDSLIWLKRCIVLFSLIKQITPDSAADIIEKKENTFAFRHFFMCDDFLLQNEYLTLGIKYLVQRHRLGICFLDLYKNLLMILMCTNCILDISCKQSWTMRLGFFCTVRRVIFKATLTINYYSPRSISGFLSMNKLCKCFVLHVKSLWLWDNIV